MGNKVIRPPTWHEIPVVTVAPMRAPMVDRGARHGMCLVEWSVGQGQTVRAGVGTCRG
jgi:hypothetical protein